MQVIDNDMDELFARKLGNMEVPPPEDGWIRIEKELNRQKIVARRYWMAAASFALLLSVTATMVYIQTNLPKDASVVVVAAQENTSQLPEEQPSFTGDPHAATQEEIGKSQSAENSIVQVETTKNEQISAKEPVVESDIFESDIPDSDIPAYTDSWDELLRIQPIRLNWREFASQKLAQLKLENPDIQKNEMLATTSPDLPGFDEFAYFDVTKSTTKSQPRQRWEMTGQFAPMYSYRAISGVPSGLRRSDFDDAESPLLVFSGGISLSYSVLKRLSVQTGVFYSQMGQTINNVIPIANMYLSVSSINLYTKNFVTKNFVRTSTGSVSVTSNLKSDANSSYSNFFNPESEAAVANTLVPNSSNPAYRLIERLDYLEIPLILNFKIIDRKLNLYVLGGMSANILINNKVFVDNGSEIIKGGAILMARPVNYSTSFGLGIGYQITRNLSFELEPSFKCYIKSYTTNSQIDSNPYAFGVFSGVVYRF